jgi:hypothetical protein
MVVMVVMFVVMGVAVMVVISVFFMVRAKGAA